MTISTTTDALMAYILERPEDDTPRLVLADWFEDNGEPERTEFVRVQCEISRHPLGHVDCYDAVIENRLYCLRNK